MDSDEKAVLKTILYSDIFHFPLTLSEITNYLIHTRLCSKETVQKSLKKLDSYLFCKHGFFSPRECKTDIIRRQRQQLFVKKKQRIAIQAAQRLMLIPTIQFVGISGGLSVGNAQEIDDIDLFFICRHNTLWISRFLVLCVLELTGVRRKRTVHVAPDKICANMFIDETALTFPKNRQDLYTARELVQLLPIFDREDSYEKLRLANQWSASILPNATLRKPLLGHVENANKLIVFCLTLLEPIAKFLQLFYMRPHKTSETATSTRIAFHPHDYRQSILSALQKKQREYNIS